MTSQDRPPTPSLDAASRDSKSSQLVDLPLVGENRMAPEHTKSTDCEPAGVEEALRLARPGSEKLGRCGDHPTLGNVTDRKDLNCASAGCGEPFVYDGERYRCTDCDVVLHKRCAIRHFAASQTTPSAAAEVEQMRMLMTQVVEKCEADEKAARSERDAALARAAELSASLDAQHSARQSYEDRWTNEKARADAAEANLAQMKDDECPKCLEERELRAKAWQRTSAAEASAHALREALREIMFRTRCLGDLDEERVNAIARRALGEPPAPPTRARFNEWDGPGPAAEDAGGPCGADDHPVFTYPCVLPKGHAGPHDNGSGNPWESKR